VKLTLQELFTLKGALDSATIKGSDAAFVATLLVKLVEELQRLEAEQGSQPQPPGGK